ncbi:hypothetical protein CWI36_0090p0030 [Hamiltosporidium magnivora]|uniref:Protein transport protein BOS1 n=1 Tax=Hamiltosporidium magnivora TaxID=148818 RepID=A0A4Q9LNJ4_9MICR|nr:hypothetical protein CWI36_0090p0030 [Hamiltosporidium magnivora]
MYDKTVQKLNKMQNEIIKELEKLEKLQYNTQNINMLNNLILNFNNFLLKSEPFFSSLDENENIKRKNMYRNYKSKIESFNQQIKEINDNYVIQQHLEEDTYVCDEPVTDFEEKEIFYAENVNKKINLNNEINSSIKINNFEDQEISTYDTNTNSYIKINNFEDKNISTGNTRRLNSYIETALDSLESLKKQRVYIDNTKSKIREGLIGLGLSSQVVDDISNRYLNDYYFFWVGVGIVVLIFLLFRFFI